MPCRRSIQKESSARNIPVSPCTLIRNRSPFCHLRPMGIREIWLVYIGSYRLSPWKRRERAQLSHYMKHLDRHQIRIGCQFCSCFHQMLPTQVASVRKARTHTQDTTRIDAFPLTCPAVSSVPVPFSLLSSSRLHKTGLCPGPSPHAQTRPHILVQV